MLPTLALFFSETATYRASRRIPEFRLGVLVLVDLLVELGKLSLAEDVLGERVLVFVDALVEDKVRLDESDKM